MSGLDEYLDRSGFVCADVLCHSLDMTVPSSAYLIHTLDPNYFILFTGLMQSGPNHHASIIDHPNNYLILLKMRYQLTLPQAPWRYQFQLDYVCLSRSYCKLLVGEKGNRKGKRNVARD
jgi:hypothetical protein